MSNALRQADPLTAISRPTWAFVRVATPSSQAVRLEARTCLNAEHVEQDDSIVSGLPCVRPPR